MIRILSVLATVMLLNVLGLFLLQGRSGVGKAAGNFVLLVYWIQSRYFYSSQLLISLPFFPHILLFLHCKVFSMPWWHPSSTPVVSRSPAGRLAPRAPLALRCQGPQRQSPEPSAARVTRTRTKSASTTATWISSGSTPPSKICLVGWLLNIEAGCPVMHISGLARQVNFIFCNQG